MATYGKLIYNPRPPHECDAYHRAPYGANEGRNLYYQMIEPGAIWQCECGRYWLAKGYGTSGTMMWTDFRQRHLKKLAERHEGTLKKGMATGNGPAPTVPPTVVCYREDVGMEQG